MVSPDGARVAYAEQDRIWVVPVDGGPPKEVLEGGEPVWTADGLLLASVERDRSSALVQVDPDDPWPVPVASGEGDCWGADPSPDGSKVGVPLLAPRRPQPHRDPRRRPRHRRGPGHHGHPGAPRPGRPVVTRRVHAGVHRRATRVARGLPHRRRTARASASSPTAATTGRDLAWHPDSDRLVGVRDRHGVTDLVVVDVATGALDVLAEGGAWSRPLWLADGRVLAGHESFDRAAGVPRRRARGRRRRPSWPPPPRP